MMRYIVLPGSSENLAGGPRTYYFSAGEAGLGDEGDCEGIVLDG